MSRNYDYVLDYSDVMTLGKHWLIVSLIFSASSSMLFVFTTLFGVSLGVNPLYIIASSFIPSTVPLLFMFVVHLDKDGLNKRAK